MYKKHKIGIGVILVIAFSICYFLALDFSDIIGDIISAISIILGFSIAALTSMLGRDYLTAMQKRVDKQNQTQTELFTVMKYYKFNVCVNIVTIIILIFYKAFIGKLTIQPISPIPPGQPAPFVFANFLGEVLSASVFSLIVIDFVSLWFVFNLFITFIRNDAHIASRKNSSDII